MFESLDNYRPVLWWSGGLDSTLLLAMLREEGRVFDIVQMREFWTQKQKKRVDQLIKDWDLKVFSYAPAAVNFIGEGDNISILQEFVVANTVLPMVMDVVEGERCSLTVLKGLRMTYSPIQWDFILTGSRKEDSHYARTQVVPADRWKVGETEFWAPLYNLTREDVKRELKIRGLNAEEASEQEDTGNGSFCSNCLQGKGKVWCPAAGTDIDSIAWSPTANLAAFHAAYGISH